MGYFILTQTGQDINYKKPVPAHFTLEDIARALSRHPRFCGHTKKFYSVAQHSVGVSLIARALAPDTLRLTAAFEGLMHDAHEAYTGDAPTPFKNAVDEEKVYSYPHPVGAYRAVQNRLDKALRKQFGLFETEPAYVKFADRLALLLEATSDNIGKDLKAWGRGLFDASHFEAIELLPEKTLDYIREPLTERRAHVSFLNEFNQIVNERKHLAESLGKPITVGALTFKRR